MFNIKLSLYPTLILASAVVIPIFYFIKKRFFYKPVETITHLSPEEKYLKKARDMFDKSYHNKSYHNKSEKYNENIDPVFFNKAEYSEVTKEPNSFIELSWRRRIMFENTPRGNIIMFYDSFKQGFSYYSDQHMSYPILNAAAMKYVIIYRCRDFFMDEQIITQDSRLLDLYKKEKEDSIKKKEETIGKIDTKAGPFAKFKSYVKPSDPVSSAVVTNKISLPKVDIKLPNPITNKDLVKNKFIYLGKTMNWNILNKISKKKTYVVPKSKLLSDLENNSDVQGRVFSYKDFKKGLTIT
jgi:hypothetical protein